MADKQERFVTVMALIDPDGVVQVFPGFSTTASHRATVGDRGEYAAVFLRPDGEVLLEQSLPAQELCTDGGPPVGLALMGKIPLPDGANRLRLVRRDQTLVEVPVVDRSPAVELTWRPGERPLKRETISWTAQHPDEQSLHFIVTYDPIGDDSWRPISLVTDQMSHEVDFLKLPGGERCRVGVLCSDGFNTVQTSSEPFSVPLRPCQPFIVSPLDEEQFDVDEQVVLRGQGYWMEEDRPEEEDLIWWSSRDGRLGRGGTLPVSLTPGVHAITLAAGRQDRVGMMTVTVSMGAERRPA